MCDAAIRMPLGMLLSQTLVPDLGSGSSTSHLASLLICTLACSRWSRPRLSSSFLTLLWPCPACCRRLEDKPASQKISAGLCWPLYLSNTVKIYYKSILKLEIYQLLLAVPFLIQLPDDAPECVSKGMPPVFGPLQLKGGISDVPSTWLFLI